MRHYTMAPLHRPGKAATQNPAPPFPDFLDRRAIVTGPRGVAPLHSSDTACRPIEAHRLYSVNPVYCGRMHLNRYASAISMQPYSIADPRYRDKPLGINSNTPWREPASY